MGFVGQEQSLEGPYTPSPRASVCETALDAETDISESAISICHTFHGGALSKAIRGSAGGNSSSATEAITSNMEIAGVTLTYPNTGQEQAG